MRKGGRNEAEAQRELRKTLEEVLEALGPS
jgi:hypothetical protein